jgi:hypothetical protein
MIWLVATAACAAVGSTITAARARARRRAEWSLIDARRRACAALDGRASR